jgi:Neuraminidase (sialidase)
MRRSAGLFAAVVVLAAGPVGVVRADTLVTDDTTGNYQRANGASQDATMLACSTGRRTQNEPSVAVDPRNPQIIVAGSNDYCAEIVNGSGNVWAGYYRSTNGGTDWSESLVPGYPADDSPEGTGSPTHGSCAAAGDPTQSFDGTGHLYYGFICFNRATPTNGSIYVARYDNDGATYVRTVRVERGTPSVWGLFQDKINIAVDQSTGGATSGNVYVAWARYSGQAANNTIFFTRSTDGGQTFSKPVRLTGGHAEEQFADIGIGPNGAVYVTYREIAHQKSTENRVRIVRSTDGGQTFSAPSTVAPIVPFDSTDFGPDTCGDGPFACDNGLTYARFSSLSAVAADAQGVHVVWSARTVTGQAKIFARNSTNGLDWTTPATEVSTAPNGHQFFPDVASAGGVLSVVFQDSRDDGSYSPTRPPGNTAAGSNSGNVVNAFVARSTDGGLTWGETPVSSEGTNPNWEVRGSMRSPFFGDYNYASAATTTTGLDAGSVWTDTRDLDTGTDPRETNEDDDADGFDGRQTCTWTPNDIDAPSYSSPTIADPCLSQGGLDQNIYFALTH